jgi:hypothetical protein
MHQNNRIEIAQRRLIEDELISLGDKRATLAQDEGWTRERIRRLVGPAREAGIKIRDISRLTGLSTQTLHTWMLDLMRPIPDIHLALAGPAPLTLEQSALRTMGEKPTDHEWQPEELLTMIPEGWPTGNVQQIDAALERMVRWHMIWEGESGYRVAPPNDNRV